MHRSEDYKLSAHITEALIASLPTGEENAVSMRDLAVRFGTDERAIRKAIHEARESGVIICSGNSGYWIPDTEYQLVSFYRLAHSRAMSTLNSLKATRERLLEMGVDVE